MEPVTHFLTGACMSRAGFNRKSAYATLTMVLAAEAADLDVLWAIKGPIAAFQHHRGITHTFVATPVVAAATVGFVYLLSRWRGPSGQPKISRSKLPVRWGYLFWLALLAALSHILLDYTTAYGIRMFAPFDWRWYSWDIVFIIEPVMLLALIAGLTFPWLFALINEEIGALSRGPRGRAGAIFALVCLLVIWSYRDYQHRRALNAMSALLYQGAVPTKMAAYPYGITPFRWHGVVETESFFQTVPVNSLVPAVDEQSEAQTYYKPEETPVTRAAKASYFGSIFLDWAVFPITQTEQLAGDFKGYLVRFQDLRFEYPERRGSGTLGGWVLVAPNLQVQEEGMNSRKPPIDPNP
ncbi:MAG TPA: metal-dependent hydrolase [Terriglobales bacterium]